MNITVFVCFYREPPSAFLSEESHTRSLVRKYVSKCDSFLLWGAQHWANEYAFVAGSRLGKSMLGEFQITADFGNMVNFTPKIAPTN